MNRTLDFAGQLAFLRAVEPLKDTLRSAHTAGGRQESTAEHSWRLCLWAMLFAEHLPEIDPLRLLKICVLHDLGEAINGDIPAIEQHLHPSKAADERADFQSLLTTLPLQQAAEFLALWDEYENASSPEGRIAKALDKLETILQHLQGRNPESFDYTFNLDYGAERTRSPELVAAIRAVLDEETRKRATAVP